MVQTRHTILRTTVQVTLPERKDALKNQEKISLLFNHTLKPSLNDSLNSVCAPSEKLQIDYLEIDLGTIDLNDPVTVLRRFENQLKKKLIFQREKSIGTITPKVDSEFSHFLFFLVHGYLPWNAGEIPLVELCQNILEQKKWEKGKLVSLISILYAKNARNRLYKQVIPSFLDRLKGEVSKQFPFLTKAPIKKQDILKENHVTLNGLLDKAYEKIKNESPQSISKEHLIPILEQHNQKNLIPVKFAGCILLSPILKPLFSDLGLIDQGKFIDENTQEKAVFVLHYLSSGTTFLEENESVLYKLLCGLTTSHAISQDYQLSKKTKKRCEEALRSLIYEWKALKNTSINGLRENFIKRDGNLQISNDRYELTVEQRTIDVLLNHSPPPWTVGFIHHPWMENFLFVNWF